METVPALLRSDDDTRRMQTALIENVAREDLNPVDEARACAALVETSGSRRRTWRVASGARPALSNLIRLLDLPDEVLDLLADGELSGPRTRDPAGAGQRRAAAAGARRCRRVRSRAEARPGRARGAADAEVIPHPDQEAALLRAEEALEEAFGHGVKGARRARAFAQPRASRSCSSSHAR